MEPVLLILLLLAGMSSLQAQQESPGLTSQPCIAIVGDSIARGTLVVQVPGHGFPVIETVRFSTVFEQHLNTSLDANPYHIQDFTVEATTLNPANPDSYFNTSAYQELQRSTCRFVLIFPWMNELPQGNQQTARLAADDYIRHLTYLSQQIRQSAPDAHLIYLSHYLVPYSELGFRIYNVSTAPHIIRAMNETLHQACRVGGILYDMGQTTCIDITTFFTPTDTYIYRTITANEFYQRGFTPLDAQTQNYFSSFWGRYPADSILADSVHLNRTAKNRLSAYLLHRLQMINPLMFYRQS